MSIRCKEGNPDKKGICITCTEPGCNGEPRVKPPTLSCVQCDKSIECAFGQNNTQTVQCKNDIPFGSEENCYTYFDAGNKPLAQASNKMTSNQIGY